MISAHAGPSVCMSDALFTADSRFHVLRAYPEPEHNRTVIEMEEID